ncbi:MAG: hypothetical protein L6R37_007178 [Teloschistes peruensis]|nr:MAG: hypothetical protein L6R37_007178 [Teloschistes peruensis]
MDNASHQYFKVYVPNIEAVLSSQTLPNLEALDWEDHVCPSQSCFQTLAYSTIKHLGIFRARIFEDFNLKLLESRTANGWPLRTLYLKFVPSFPSFSETNSSSLWEDVLCLCSRTLEDLTLVSNVDQANDAVTGNDSPKFPRLRRLKIYEPKLKDASTLEALVHDGLRYLDIDIYSGRIHVNFLQRRGNIPSLESFISYSRRDDELPDIFLRSNPQIKTLAFACALPETTIEYRILPVTNFTSLRLAWACSSITNSALQQISLLKSLKQVYLSAGATPQRLHDWPINHDNLRQHLCTLPLLEKMAFRGDIYPTGRGWSPNGTSYYIFSTHYSLNPESAAKWERSHRNRILVEANKYVNAMPALRWMYFGQLLMSVEVHNRPIKRKNGKMMKTWPRSAHMLSEERDDDEGLLNRTFGGFTY